MALRISRAAVGVLRGHHKAHPPDELQRGVGAPRVVGHDQGGDAFGLQQARGHLGYDAVGKGFQHYGVVEVQNGPFLQITQFWAKYAASLRRSGLSLNLTPFINFS